MGYQKGDKAYDIMQDLWTLINKYYEPKTYQTNDFINDIDAFSNKYSDEFTTDIALALTDHVNKQLKEGGTS